jgi:cytochrome c nitrite reductase small subunit
VTLIKTKRESKGIFIIRRYLTVFFSCIAIALFFLVISLSNATSYIKDEPDACINCHVMVPQYVSWEKDVHKLSTTCNDCHVPHNSLVDHFWFKVKDGLRHAAVFSLRWEPQVIRIKPAGISVVQNNCIRCHEELVKPGIFSMTAGQTGIIGGDRKCWDCHRDVPHGRVQGLASSSLVRVPGQNFEK